MKAEFYAKQIDCLLKMVNNNQGDEADEMSTLKTDHFLDPERLQQEKNMFRRMPLIVGHSNEIPCAGDYIVRELDDRSWLIVRGKDLQVRAFYNYCQHRGTKLVQDEKGECQNRFTCPYHAWTYSNLGDLVGLPRGDLFPGLDKKSKALKQANLQEAYGLLWLTQNTQPSVARSIGDYLGGLESEFEALGLEDYHLYFDKTRELKANWKFPLFAFLESYHLAVLHKDSIADFFIQNIAHSEFLEPHIRSFVPRSNVRDLATADLSKVNISEFLTPTNIIFPNICMISHPTSISFLSVFPGKTPETSTWRHMLLVPKLPETDKERAHYDKTVDVLDGLTYHKEDFWVSELGQEGISAGAIDEFVLSKNENLIKVFDQLVEQHL